MITAASSYESLEKPSVVINIINIVHELAIVIPEFWKLSIELAVSRKFYSWRPLFGDAVYHRGQVGVEGQHLQ